MLASNRIIPSALFNKIASVRDQTGVKREPHLHKPHPLQNQPHPTTQTRKLGSGVPQFDKRRADADGDGNEKEVEVAILDPIWVLPLEVEEEEFLPKTKEGDQVEDRGRQGEKMGEIGEESGEGVEEEDGGDGDGGELEGGSDAVVVAGGVEGGDGGVDDGEEGEEGDCYGGYGGEGLC